MGFGAMPGTYRNDKGYQIPTPLFICDLWSIAGELPTHEWQAWRLISSRYETCPANGRLDIHSEVGPTCYIWGSGRPELWCWYTLKESDWLVIGDPSRRHNAREQEQTNCIHIFNAGSNFVESGNECLVVCSLDVPEGISSGLCWRRPAVELGVSDNMKAICRH